MNKLNTKFDCSDENIHLSRTRLWNLINNILIDYEVPVDEGASILLDTVLCVFVAADLSPSDVKEILEGAFQGFLEKQQCHFMENEDET